jgi:hypothetical protein
LIAAIVPALDIATAIDIIPRLNRHLREPPRRRQYQSTVLLC